VAFDYRTATRTEIAGLAHQLKGRLLGELGALLVPGDPIRSKAQVGYVVESFFGIPANARPEADFPLAKVELKVVPLRRTRSGFVAKERTVISMIDYNKIVEEVWSDARIREKLQILFVFFEHLEGQPKEAFPILEVNLWVPDQRALELLRSDWSRIRDKVRHGLAHELTESDGRIMGASTKASSSLVLRGQPFSSTLAKPRAFSLKPSFTTELFRETQAGTQPSWNDLGVDDVDQFEQQLLGRFEPFIELTVDEAADRLGMTDGGGKAYAAGVSRRIFGGRGFKTEIAEFRVMGLTPRVVRVDERRYPYESTSFPAFRYDELLSEAWEDSDLLARIEYMLLIPLVGAMKGTPQGSCRFAKPRFWRPSAADIDLIRQEWELFRIEIEQGKADRLAPASGTVAIHVRPHARNARDTDEAPGIGPIVRKSFWLNRLFVAQILRGER
jgi:DNA mismatch repair endonuclease MutH